MLIHLILFAIAAITMVWGLVGPVGAGRRTYLASDFKQASARIRTRLCALVSRLERNGSSALEELLLSEGLALPEWACAEAAMEKQVLRRECRLMLHDMLDATSYILGLSHQAARWYRGNPPAGAEVFGKLERIFQGGVSLRMAILWASLQLAVPISPEWGARSTLEAGRRFVTLCVDFLEMLQNQSTKVSDGSSHNAIV